MRARSSNWLLLSLVALSALVIAELRFEIGTGPGDQAAVQAGTPVAAAPMPLFALVDRESFSETLTRPLFMPERQPPGDTPVAPTVQASRAARPNANRYALSAIIIVDNERFALLTDTATGGLSRVRVGESLAGWQVEEIHESGAVLSNGDTREELSLRSFGPPAPRPKLPGRRTGREREAAAQPAGDNPRALLNRPRRPKRGPGQTLRIPAGEAN
ncbi:MAG: hypothetical protein BMS9Abin01_1630 [Gammaproteobacteria bacterium]|nr:MAG: hypothetical protein BMS9Abin01_1630 [Gammaproteobacteria bacterium]